MTFGPGRPNAISIWCGGRRRTKKSRNHRRHSCVISTDLDPSYARRMDFANRGGSAMRCIRRMGLAVALLLSPQAASAEEKDPLAVIGLGAAFERSSGEGQFSRGPTASVEFNVIKDWLEIEVGGAKLFRRSNSEWEAEVVFRKPFDLSETTEFMVGLGPMWTQAKGEGTKRGTTFMLDF